MRTAGRLWEALQVVERFGVPVAALVEWTRIVSPAATPAQRFAIARDLKEAIKARFEPEAWQRIAQPIFDKLRQRQRDALVAYVMHQHGFDAHRAALRVFPDRPRHGAGGADLAHPAGDSARADLHPALPAQPGAAGRRRRRSTPKQWQWMKRYRVWEANRKIFLFPENWLEPEFRDDKTHLFRSWKARCCRATCRNDLVEDAFFNYLQKLEELARLDIVAMYCEEQPLDPASNTAARDRAHLRRAAQILLPPLRARRCGRRGSRSPSRSRAITWRRSIWRDRLNLFWVTFHRQPGPDAQAVRRYDDFEATVFSRQFRIKPANWTGLPVGSKDPRQKLDRISLGQVAGGMRSAVSTKLVEVQLHWSEYFQGSGASRESGGYQRRAHQGPCRSTSTASVSSSTRQRSSTPTAKNVRVKIHLGGADQPGVPRGEPATAAASRADREAPPPIPYTAPQVQANRYRGAGRSRSPSRSGSRPRRARGPRRRTSNAEHPASRAATLRCCRAPTPSPSARRRSPLWSTPFFYQDNR